MIDLYAPIVRRATLSQVNRLMLDSNSCRTSFFCAGLPDIVQQPEATCTVSGSATDSRSFPCCGYNCGHTVYVRSVKQRLCSGSRLPVCSQRNQRDFFVLIPECGTSSCIEDESLHTTGTPEHYKTLGTPRDTQLPWIANQSSKLQQPVAQILRTKMGKQTNSRPDTTCTEYPLRHQGPQCKFQVEVELVH